MIVASRELHLRPGLARGLLRHAADAGKGPEDLARGDHPQAGRNSLRAQRRRFPARHVPRARRRHRGLSHLRRHGLSHRAVGRRGRILSQIDPLLGTGEADICAPAHLSQDALRDDARRPRSKAMAVIRERAGMVGSGTGKAGQADRGAAPAPAHHVRSGDDQGDRLLPRHRELFAAFLRPPARRSRRPRCSIICRTTP